MGGIKKRINKIITEHGAWVLAIRKRSDPLYKGGNAPFTLIPNTSRYWRADPFLFSRGGKDYLFAELFDRANGKGVLGVAEIIDGEYGKFKKCLDMPYHLSYPCVFERGGEVYMVPESGRAGKVVVYKCTDFPLKWEEAYILHGDSAVDTTPFELPDGRIGFLTTLHPKGKKADDNLAFIAQCEEPKVLVENDLCARGAGHIIKDGDGYVRPSQDDAKGYGDSLLFNLIDSPDPENYKEHTLMRAYPPEKNVGAPDISVRVEGNTKGLHFEGIHTYNISDKYEIIDLGYSGEKHWLLMWKKVKKHFRR